MFPDQPQSNDNQPQPVYPPAPNPYQAPPASPSPLPQQAPNGQYQVVPPLPIGQNNGHSGHNPYEFIVNPGTGAGRKRLFSGIAPLKRLGIIGGVALVIIIVLVVALSALAPKGPTDGLKRIAERQQEIIRVATAAAGQATSQDTQNFAASVELTITSAQYQVTSYLASHGTKLSTKQLALDQSTQTDSTLAAASAANTYDSAVVQNLSGQLTTYRSLIQTTFNDTSKQQLKQQLQAAYNAAGSLLKQAATTAT